MSKLELFRRLVCWEETGALHKWLDRFLHEDIFQWLSENLITSPAASFTRPNYPWHDLVCGLPTFPWTNQPPLLEWNSIWYPTGASRCAVALVLADHDLEDNYDWYVFTHGYDNPTMILRPILSLRITEGLYAVVMSDKRYFDRVQAIPLPSPSNGTGWDSYGLQLSDLFDPLPGNIRVKVPDSENGGWTDAPLENAGLYPWLLGPVFWNATIPFGPLLDAMAAMVGQRVYYDSVNDMYYLQRPDYCRETVEKFFNPSGSEAEKPTFRALARADFPKNTFGGVTMSAPIYYAEPGRYGIDPDRKRKVYSYSSGNRLMLTSIPAVYYYGQWVNQNTCLQVAAVAASYLQEWCSYEHPAVANVGPFRWCPTALDDYVFLRIERLRGNCLFSQYVSHAILRDCYPIDWPFWDVVYAEPPQSSSAPPSDRSIPSISSSGSSIRSDSGSPSVSRSSESAPSSQSGSPSVSRSSESVPSSQSGSPSASQSASWSEAGSDKSTAIVPASWSPTGYVALFVHEMPEVRFDDVMILTIPMEDQEIPIDPRFVEVCERGSIEVCGISIDQPIRVGARALTDRVRLTFEVQNPQQAARVVLRLTGIRRGFAGKRFPLRTYEQFLANEAWINSAYPPS